jgi:hypothetical protein
MNCVCDVPLQTLSGIAKISLLLDVNVAQWLTRNDMGKPPVVSVMMMTMKRDLSNAIFRLSIGGLSVMMEGCAAEGRPCRIGSASLTRTTARPNSRQGCH